MMTVKGCRVVAVLAMVIIVMLNVGESVDAGVFGLKSQSIGTEDTAAPAVLFYFEEDRSSLIEIGTITVAGIPVDADALALVPQGGLYAYMLDDSGSTLLTLDTATAVGTPIGSPLAGREIRGAAADRCGNIWVFDLVAQELIYVDPSNGAVLEEPIGIGLGWRLESDIALSTQGTMYFGTFNVPSDSGSLWVVDWHSWALQLVFQDPDGPAGRSLAGIAFSSAWSNPEELFALDQQGGEDLLRYSVEPDFNRVTLFENIILSFNAGGADLAAHVEFNEGTAAMPSTRDSRASP